jgi:hypothetical protein
MKRNQDLTPSQAEQTAVTNIVNKIQAVLDGLIVSPGNFDACVSFQTFFPHFFFWTDLAIDHWPVQVSFTFFTSIFTLTLDNGEFGSLRLPRMPSHTCASSSSSFTFFVFISALFFRIFSLFAFVLKGTESAAFSFFLSSFFLSPRDAREMFASRWEIDSNELWGGMEKEQQRLRGCYSVTQIYTDLIDNKNR